MIKATITANDIGTLDRLFRYLKYNLETREHATTRIEYLSLDGQYVVEVENYR